MKKFEFILLFVCALMLSGCTFKNSITPYGKNNANVTNSLTPTVFVPDTPIKDPTSQLMPTDSIKVTAIITQTPLPAFTCTPTYAPTCTPTFTCMPTYTPTPTFTPSPTQTPTPTPTQIPAYDFFNHSYFSIIKERLQTYTTDTLCDALTSSEFASYETPVDIHDFNKYEITDTEVIFYFPENTFTASHPAFTYSVDIAEAELFMNYDENGTDLKDSRIRKDLDQNAKMIALTYDDGPYLSTESELIKIFEKYSAKATFFVLGDRIDTWDSCKKSAKILYDAGCQVETHTYSHMYFRESTFTAENFWKELNKSVLTIANATGHAPSYIRMPGGFYREYMKNCTLPIMYWTASDNDSVTEYRSHVDSDIMRDGNGNIIYDKDGNVVYDEDAYYTRLAEKFSEFVIKQAKDSSVVLIHSIKRESPLETEIFMSKLSEEGYIFVTLDELAYYRGFTFEDGVLYFR